MTNSPLVKVVLCMITLSISTTALAQGFPAVLSGAVTKLRDSKPVQVLLPKFFPSVIPQSDIKRVDVELSKTGYSVALYYSTEVSDATYAGMFSGSNVVDSFSSLPGTSYARLSNGEVAKFDPVSCGGSCAPANLWWHVGKFEYQLQIIMRSDLSVIEQRRALVEMANSMSRLH